MEVADEPSDIAGNGAVLPVSYWDYKPRQLVAAALFFSFGTALGVAQVDWVVVAIVFVVLVTLRIFNVKICHLLLVCSAFLIGFANAEIKYPRPGKNDICQFSGRSLIVKGKLVEDFPFSNGGGERLTLLCTSVCESASKRGFSTGEWQPVEGRLQVIVSQQPAFASFVHGRRPLKSTIDGIASPASTAKSGLGATATSQAASWVKSGPGGTAKSEPASMAKPEPANMANAGAPSKEKDKTIIPRYQIGEELVFRGTVLSLAALHHKNIEHLRFLLARKKIFAELRTSSTFKTWDAQTVDLTKIDRSSKKTQLTLEDVSSYWREALVGFHAEVLGEKDGKLLASMVLGDRAATPSKEISDNFRASGLSHILAASGFNLTVVSSSIYFVLRYFIQKLWLANAVCFVGMFVFVAIAGASPSVMRAFIMCSLMLLSRCLCRNLHMPAALALTMTVVLFFDPVSAADVGFQLSYFSTAGMILGATAFTDLLNNNCPRCPEWIRVTFAATMVAQSCVLPLQLYYFKQLTPYCLLANVVVAPAVPILTIVGFASSLLFWFESVVPVGHFLSTNIDRLCYFPLELTRIIVAAFAGLPSAQIATGNASLPAVLLYYVVLISFPLFEQHGRGKHWCVLIALALSLLLASINTSA